MLPTTWLPCDASWQSDLAAMETWNAITSRRNVRLPAGKSCAFLTSLGYPANRLLAPIKNPDRRPFDDVVHRGHW